MGQIYLVRHGQASFGSGNYDQLSSLGTEQARLLGAWFAHCNLTVDRVVTGGMQRHRQTASACLSMLPASLKVTIDTQTDTKFAAALIKDPAFSEQWLQRIPLRRVAEPGEMAGAVVYLASNASSYTTGTCINVDGGYLAG